MKNELVKASIYSTKDVPELLETINSKIEQIQNPVKKNNNANGKSLTGFGCIEDITDLSTLIKAHSSVTGKAKAYAESESILKDKGIIEGTAPTFELEGCSDKEWCDSIESRYREIAYKKQLDALIATRDKLKKYITKDQQFIQDMKEISELLK